MEYCPLDQAFEILPRKKEEKKKHRKHKASLEFLDPNFNPSAVDSDRPAGKLSELLSLKDLKEAFTDVSSNIVLPKTGTKLPNYFTGYDDDNEGFTSTFTKDDEKGKDKATGVKQLPLPSLEDVWKPMTPTQTSNTSYFNSLPTPGGTFPVWNDSHKILPPNKASIQRKEETDLQDKVDTLMKRLDALEKEYKGNGSNSKKEILMFIGTGLALIFSLHLLRR